jgi:hypothetical protein
MGPSRFISHPKEGVLRIFIALKNPSPWPGSNPRPLYPVLGPLPPQRVARLPHSCSWWRQVAWRSYPVSWRSVYGFEGCLKLPSRSWFFYNTFFSFISLFSQLLLSPFVLQFLVFIWIFSGGLLCFGFHLNNFQSSFSDRVLSYFVLNLMFLLVYLIFSFVCVQYR